MSVKSFLLCVVLKMIGLHEVSEVCGPGGVEVYALQKCLSELCNKDLYQVCRDSELRAECLFLETEGVTNIQGCF